MDDEKYSRVVQADDIQPGDLIKTGWRGLCEVRHISYIGWNLEVHFTDGQVSNYGTNERVWVFR